MFIKNEDFFEKDTSMNKEHVLNLIKKIQSRHNLEQLAVEFQSKDNSSIFAYFENDLQHKAIIARGDLNNPIDPNRAFLQFSIPNSTKEDPYHSLIKNIQNLLVRVNCLIGDNNQMNCHIQEIITHDFDVYFKVITIGKSLLACSIFKEEEIDSLDALKKSLSKMIVEKFSEYSDYTPESFYEHFDDIIALKEMQKA